jgi:hypothetical protein
MIGVKNMIVVLGVCDRSRKGTDAERKRTSSVMGPWNKISEEFAGANKINILQQNCATPSNY